ncbi:hypothetical protein HGI30_04775 [Paenibacillus albicereus]|uniref:Uncharacterized protein n=1 Tax=Paenibacillus albicereus TaxID=2726185 RepID=A0A6H2GU76_9BACL|nr:hypothetical protein [Paenibacillus albicereus]QJC50942.1 hypothetical protein HGI30_04775 [Paenibacillus albicereus]
MSTWKGAVRLARYEWSLAGHGSWLNLILVLYFALTTFPLLGDLTEPQAPEGGWYSGGAANFIMLALLPCFGFFLNRATLGGWRLNYMSGKLAAWRQLPITGSQIAAGRLLTMLTLLVPSLLLLMALQYAMVLRHEIDPGGMALYALFWIGYAAAGGSLYAWLEIVMDGKLYLLFCSIVTAVLIVVGSILSASGFEIMRWTLEQAAAGRWLPMLATAAAGAAVTIAVHRLIARSLGRRSFHA